jgi:hypothetical protein
MMDLIEYERAKFELAAILRSAAVLLREEKPDIQGPFRIFSRAWPRIGSIWWWLADSAVARARS